MKFKSTFNLIIDWRNYSINIFDLYHYNIHLDLKAYNYNNFIALAFSNHNTIIEECKDDNDYYRSCIALIILNYPNSTDNNIILDEYLRRNFTINNINISLENNLIFENNIFGYKLSGIYIRNIINCDNLKIITSLYNNSIYLNYTLTKDEIIKLEFSGNNYKSFNCNLQYNFIITEPETLYSNYLVESDGDEVIINEEYYIGRLTYFDIILKENLTDECNNANCDLCFISNKSFCINCKYNYTFFQDGTKNCSDSIQTINSIDFNNNTYNLSDNINTENIYLISSIITDNYIL